LPHDQHDELPTFDRRQTAPTVEFGAITIEPDHDDTKSSPD
jgi:hypothetical protein